MSNAKQTSSVWDKVLKVIIAVASAILGAEGTQDGGGNL